MTTQYEVYTNGSFVGKRAKKLSAIALGEGVGADFEVRTDSGTVVYTNTVPTPNPEPEQKREQRGTELSDYGREVFAKIDAEDAAQLAEEDAGPMTKAIAFTLVRDARSALRGADGAIKDNSTKKLHEIAKEMKRSADALLAALEGPGIRGMR